MDQSLYLDKIDRDFEVNTGVEREKDKSDRATTEQVLDH